MAYKVNITINASDLHEKMSLGAGVVAGLYAANWTRKEFNNYNRDWQVHPLCKLSCQSVWVICALFIGTTIGYASVKSPVVPILGTVALVIHAANKISP